MEGMQGKPYRLTGIVTQKLPRTATSVAMTTILCPCAPSDSPGALIGTCIRFYPATVPGFSGLRLTRAPS
jgi:hypothetical protein